MPRIRFSIAGLMGVVIVAGVGMAALRNPSETWAGGMLLLTCGTLSLAIVGAVARRGTRRIGWLDFCLFGWGYLALAGCGADESWPAMPTTRGLEILAGWLGHPLHHGGVGLSGCMIPPGLDTSYLQIGHCLWALLAAALGGLLAASFCRSPGDQPERAAVVEASRPRSRWLPPTIAGLVLLILLGAVATAGSGDPFWASLTFSLTFAFSGLATLGAILDRPYRASWLGAALFGAGYTALIFSRPAGDSPRTHQATDAILNGLRRRFAPLAESLETSNTDLRGALARPVPMHFPEETSLKGVLDWIKQATSTSSYSGIPIYVDPIGLQEAEKSMASTVEIDLEGVPLRETLRLCLDQLGLVYEVRDGYLRVTSEDDDRGPDLDEPALIVGHCLLALVAAGFGAITGPIVAGGRGPDRPRDSSEAENG